MVDGQKHSQDLGSEKNNIRENQNDVFIALYLFCPLLQVPGEVWKML